MIIRKIKRLKKLESFLMLAIPNITYRDRNKKEGKEIDQQTLRQTKQQSSKKVIPFVTTNNQRNQGVYNMIKSTFQYYRMMLK